jgi:hypothetical protein
MSLTAEQRRVLALLATAGRNGATQAVLSALGFDAGMIAELVNQGLATLTAEKVRAGGKLMAVAKARITDEGGMLSPLRLERHGRAGEVGRARRLVDDRTDANRVECSFQSGGQGGTQPGALVGIPPTRSPARRQMAAFPNRGRLLRWRTQRSTFSQSSFGRTTWPCRA